MRLRYYRYSAHSGLRKIKTRTALILSAVSLAVAGTSGFSAVILSAAHADTSTTVVTAGNLDAIFSRGDWRPGKAGKITYGPATAPLGNGSLELDTPDGTNKQQYLETQQQGTLLSDIDAMSYATYRQGKSVTSPNTQVPAINMEVLVNGDSGYTTLVFEPVYNPSQGAVTADTWQNWDAYKGGDAIWWSSRSIPGVCNPNCYVSFNQIREANPKARLISFGINQGTGNGGLYANTDALQIGANGTTTTYDFEPLAAPSLVSPANGAVVNGASVTNKWTAVPGAAKYDYESYNNATLTSKRFGTTYTTNEKTATKVADTTFWWRVRAVDANGVAGSWSDAYKLTVDNKAPVVAITAPIDGSTVYGSVAIRGTVADQNPDHYYLKVTNDSGSKVYDHTFYGGQQTFLDKLLYTWITENVNDGTYHIQLAARDKAGNRDAGSEANVTVTVNNTPDNKDQCKNDGWMNFTKPDFKNQGACVSFVNHHDGRGQDDLNAHKH